MAASKKQAVSSRRSKTGSRKGSSGKTGKKKRGKSGNSLNAEISVLLVFAVSLLLFISNLGYGGTVGNAVSTFIFGLFGFSAHIFPILLFAGGAFYIVNRENTLIVRKMAGGIFDYVFLCGLMQLITADYSKDTSFKAYYVLSASDHLGGGLVGGIQVKVFAAAFGVAGAYVIIIAALVICTIIMTQRPLLAPLQDKSAKAYHHAKDVHARKKEQLRTEPVSKAASKERQFVDIRMNPEPPIQNEIHIQRSETVRAENPVQTELEKDFGIASPDISDDVLKAADISASETAEILPEKKENKKNPRSSQKEIEEGIQNIKEEIEDKETRPKPAYRLPPLKLLKKGDPNARGDSDEHLRQTAAKLQQTLHNFGVNVTVTNVSCGPTVTRYELQPEQGVKVSRIVGLTDDIKLNLAAADIRIEAPIPGKAAVGIEVPNATNSAVMLRDLLESPAFRQHPSAIAFAAGKDIAGQPVVADIAKMPHLLIAGATGSGKSVCINTLIMSILYKAKPDEVKLIMIDPKVVELSVYNGIPHLFIPVVTDPKKAAGALNWAVAEMTDRYNKFAECNVRDLKGYNAKIEQLPETESGQKPEKLPQVVIIVDELADLMMVAPGEVEDAICRLAQLARAAGIHLIIATQRPSVNVITGLIKANMPSRIAFAVSSGVDSRTILDMNGAEKLLGKGDMLFYPQGYQKPARLQGAFVSDREVADVVEFLTKNAGEHVYSGEIEQQINNAGISAGAASGSAEEVDFYFADAGKFIIEKDKASIGMLQRMFKIGFNRAARIMDQLSDAGVVGPEEGTKPRKVLMSMEEFEKYIEESL